MFNALSEKLESAFKHLKGQSRINELNVANTLKDEYARTGNFAPNRGHADVQQLVLIAPDDQRRYFDLVQLVIQIHIADLLKNVFVARYTCDGLLANGIQDKARNKRWFAHGHGVKGVKTGDIFSEEAVLAGGNLLTQYARGRATDARSIH